MSFERHWLVDVGVLLNLAADDHPEQLISDLGLALFVPRIGLAGPCRHPRTRRLVTEIGQLGLSCIQIISLVPEEVDLMLEFASPPNSLDDSEAAMLAVSECRGIGCLVDDPKITALIARRPVAVPVLSTVGLLRAAVVDQRISEVRAAETLQSMVKSAGLIVAPENAKMLTASTQHKPKGSQRNLW